MHFQNRIFAAWQLFFLGLIFGLPLSFSLQGQDLGERRSLPVYGGIVWHFSSATQGDSLFLFACANSKNTVFRAALRRNQSRKNLRWEAVPQAAVGNYFWPDVHRSLYFPSARSLFLQVAYSLDRIRPGDNWPGEVIPSLIDFAQAGDTLFSMQQNWSSPDSLTLHSMHGNGDIWPRQKFVLPIVNPSFKARIHFNPHDKKLYLFDRDSSRLSYSEKPFYCAGDTLSFSPRQFLRPLGISQDSINWNHFAVDAKGQWHLWGRQRQFNYNRPDSLRPPLWAFSGDKGQTWLVEEQTVMPSLPFEIANDFSIAESPRGLVRRGGEAISVGMGPWKRVGNRYRDSGLFAYPGAALADPFDPSISYHATNRGIGVATHYGDSLFGSLPKMEALRINQLDYDPGLNLGLVASFTGIFRVKEYGLPWAKWEGPFGPEDFESVNTVAFERSDPDLIYAGRQVLFRSRKGGAIGSWQKVLDPLALDSARFEKINELTKLRTHPDFPSLVVALFKARSRASLLYVSYNAGNDWEELLFDNSNWQVSDFALLNENGQATVYLPNSRKHEVLRIALQAGAPQISTEDLANPLPNNFTISTTEITADPGETYLYLLATFNTSSSTNPRVYFKKIGTQDWQQHSGPDIEKCFNCYTFPKAMAVDDRYVYVASGQWLYRFPAADTTGQAWEEMAEYELNQDMRVLGHWHNDIVVGTGTTLYAHSLAYRSQPRFSERKYQVFPNPTVNVLRYWPPAQVQVFDLFGRLVLESEASQSQVRLGHLSEGVYIIAHPLGEAKVIKR